MSALLLTPRRATCGVAPEQLMNKNAVRHEQTFMHWIAAGAIFRLRADLSPPTRGPGPLVSSALPKRAGRLKRSAVAVPQPDGVWLRGIALRQANELADCCDTTLATAQLLGSLAGGF